MEYEGQCIAQHLLRGTLLYTRKQLQHILHHRGALKHLSSHSTTHIEVAAYNADCQETFIDHGGVVRMEQLHQPLATITYLHHI